MGDISRNDIKKEISLPKKESEDLAEFFGVLTGDGYMNIYRKYDYVVEIAGNKVSDKEYLRGYLTELIKRLFNASPRYIEKENQNSAYLRLRSKGIFYYLLKRGFKRGKKLRIGIPLWITKDKRLMNSFVKGLFDTDGCVVIKNKEGKKYPGIAITSQSDLLLSDVKNHAKLIGISSYLAKYIHPEERYNSKPITYQLQINGYANLIRWFELIGSANQRNLKKYGLAMKKLSFKKTKI